MARSGRSGIGREAVIGRTTRVRGRITGDGDLVVEGVVDGDISVGGDLTVAAGGRATSSIEAGSVELGGEVEGDVRARGPVVIRAGARVRGDLHGQSIALEEGAELVGRLDAVFDLPPELEGGSTTGRRR